MYGMQYIHNMPNMINMHDLRNMHNMSNKHNMTNSNNMTNMHNMSKYAIHHNMQKCQISMPRNMPKNAIHTLFYGRDHLLYLGHLGYVLWIFRSFWITQGPSHLRSRRRRGILVHAAAALRRSRRLPPRRRRHFLCRRRCVDSFAASRSLAG
jgi:hypothetical protein